MACSRVESSSQFIHLYVFFQSPSVNSLLSQGHILPKSDLLKEVRKTLRKEKKTKGKKTVKKRKGHQLAVGSSVLETVLSILDEVVLAPRASEALGMVMVTTVNHLEW